jgi:predicted dehydrogenase
MRSVFYGTKGTIICDNTSPTIQLFEDDPENGKSYTSAQILPVEINNHNVTAEIDVFVDALVSGKPMPVSSMEGASSVAVCCATVEAAKVGHPVKIKYPNV